MTGFDGYQYTFFEEYQSDVLADLSSVEQLIRLDDEVANKVTIPRYQGPVDPVEWASLEAYYNRVFTEFITDRIQGIVDTEPIETNKDRFHNFRENIVSLNQNLPAQRTSRTGVISKPAETVLLKRIRQLGFDPSALNISHIGHGGGLYLLELFVTAAQQEALSDRELLTALLDEAKDLGDMSKEAAMARLHRPVLMVSLWENQEAGLNEWLENGRHGILEMATATGKTVAGIAAIAECCGTLPEETNHNRRTDNANILIVAHSNAILKQWEKEIQEKLGLPRPVGQTGEKAGTISFSSGEVEFYTAQSLLPQYDRDLADQYDLVIYDEVHHYSNLDGYGAAIDRPNYRAAMGLSATIGDDGELKREQLTELLGEVVHTYGIEDARRDGIIPEFDWTVHPTALDPYERQEWDEATESISDQFKHIQYSTETKQILERIPVPFTELEDLGDFIRAHEAASAVFNDDEIPDEWSSLQATIHSRTWIRHRSQPKIEGAIELAKGYLEDPDQPVKLVIFAMDIDTADDIADELREVTDQVFRAHSQLESSSRQNNETVQRNINKFGKCDSGVLISPKMLDEGIDVPDAEVGINVAGTKTKLQLVQRMGRVLRKHGDQRPHFHHFIAIPDENYIPGLDSKEYVQELNWVRELGETIGVQPVIEEAGVDSNLLERAEQRGHELWARDLLEDLEVETVQGNVHLEQLLEELTIEATKILLGNLGLNGERVTQDDWKAAMKELRRSDALSIEGLQRVWWLFPLYRERPAELDELLTASLSALSEEESPSQPSQEERTNTSENASNGEESTTDEETSDPIKVEPSIDETLLTSNAEGGIFSAGYLHKRPLRRYLLSDEEPAFLLSSKQRSPKHSNQSLPGLNGYRAITAITPVRVLCVIGNEPENEVIQIRHEEITDIEIEQKGKFFWKRSTIRIEANGQTIEIPDGTGTDPEAIEEYLRTASYEGRCAAGERIVECYTTVASKNKFSRDRLVLDAARSEFESALKVGRKYDLDTSQAENELDRIKTEDTSNNSSAKFEQRVAEAQQLVRTARVASINDEETKVDQKLRGAKTILESVISASEDKPNSIETEATELHACVEEKLLSENDSSEEEKESSAGSHTPDTESPCVSEGSEPSREDLINEIQRLTNELGGAPLGLEMDDKGEYSTRDYLAEFESWDGALDAADVDFKESLISELERIANKIEEVPSEEQIDEHGRYISNYYSNEFGSTSAARHAADFSTIGSNEQNSQTHNFSQESLKQSTDSIIDVSRNPGPTREALIDELQLLDDGETLIPYASQMDREGSYKKYDYYQEFGSWDDALSAAGIDKQARLLEELQRVRDKLGRMPKTTDMNHSGRVSAGMYSNFFGSWTKATSLIDGMEESNASKTTSTGKSSHEDESKTSPTLDGNQDALTWEDIPDYNRLPSVIAVKVKEKKLTHSDRVRGRYLVADLNGTEFDLKIWEKHGVEVNWEIDTWYLLGEARGTVWESDGGVKRLLDSTRDLTIKKYKSREALEIDLS